MNYKTKFTLLGLPLFHLTTGKVENGHYRRGIAKGWIAVGDIFFGVILSMGGVAFGGITIGGLAFGLLSIAGLAIGLFALGGLAFGGFALGGLAIGGFAIGGGAIGIFAHGGGAIAWQAAYGGFAMAKEYAKGGLPIANHANDQVACDYFQNSEFFTLAPLVLDYSPFLHSYLTLFFLGFLILPAYTIIRSLIKKEAS